MNPLGQLSARSYVAYVDRASCETEAAHEPAASSASASPSPEATASSVSRNEAQSESLAARSESDAAASAAEDELGLVRSGFLGKKGLFLYGRVRVKLVSRARNYEWHDVGPALQFFWDKAGKSLKSQLLLRGCEVRPRQEHGICISKNTMAWSFKAANDRDRADWLRDIRSVLSTSP